MNHNLWLIFSCTMNKLMKLFRSWDMVYVFIDCMLDCKINNLIRSLQNKEILQFVLHSYSNLLSRQLQSFFRRLLTVHPSWRFKKWKLKFAKFSIKIKKNITPLNQGVYLPLWIDCKIFDCTGSVISASRIIGQGHPQFFSSELYDMLASFRLEKRSLWVGV